MPRDVVGHQRVAQAKQTSSQPAHQLSHAEAAALAEAGLMPLDRYLVLVERHGWAVEKA
jgi:hypothetical protein